MGGGVMSGGLAWFLRPLNMYTKPPLIRSLSWYACGILSHSTCFRSLFGMAITWPLFFDFQPKPPGCMRKTPRFSSRCWFLPPRTMLPNWVARASVGQDDMRSARLVGACVGAMI